MTGSRCKVVGWGDLGNEASWDSTLGVGEGSGGVGEGSGGVLVGADWGMELVCDDLDTNMLNRREMFS